MGLLAPDAARGPRCSARGAPFAAVAAERAGTGCRADPGDLCLRHFLPARRFPDETRSQEETSQLSQIGRENMECIFPLTEHNPMSWTDSRLKTSS